MLNNVIAIIPARGGSKGIPKKNVNYFCGKPLIAWSILQAKKSKLIKSIYVSTENKEIAEISQSYGAKIINRPIELASDTATTEAAMLHVLSQLDNDSYTIVYLQPTSPLRKPTDIDEALSIFESENADSLFSASSLDDFCAWKQTDDNFESLTYDYSNRGRRQERKKYYLENGSIYVFKSEVLKEHNNRLGGKISVYLMPLWQSYEIDEPKDLEICGYFMNSKIRDLYNGY